MKKLLLVTGLLTALLMAFSLISESSNKKVTSTSGAVKAPSAAHGETGATGQPAAEDTPIRGTTAGAEKSQGKVNCKSCHDCEYPTRETPCLVRCPKSAISVLHPPGEAPEVLVLNRLSRKYGGVVFSHKVHAEMSEMGKGCSGCHHYNTTGPILNCKKCHGSERKREAIGTPDLAAAYHRQCMPCHRKWSKSTECESCHELKSAKSSGRQQAQIRKAAGKSHPRSQEPTRMVYDTGSSTGRYVTFYHNEHVAKFNLPCAGCHRDDQCQKCHEAKTASGGGIAQKETPGGKNSFEARHKRCAGCHETRNCTECHGNKVKEPFRHGVNAKWELGRFHSRLTCERCHGRKYPQKVDSQCTSCHKGWKAGSFDHAVTGLSLSRSHRELDCESCHPARDFSRKPACRECHEDLAYPKMLPGKKAR